MNSFWQLGLAHYLANHDANSDAPALHSLQHGAARFGSLGRLTGLTAGYTELRIGGGIALVL
jgi:hypothetical protein